MPQTPKVEVRACSGVAKVAHFAGAGGSEFCQSDWTPASRTGKVHATSRIAQPEGKSRLSD
jgi:hypothetical protein